MNGIKCRECGGEVDSFNNYVYGKGEELPFCSAKCVREFYKEKGDGKLMSKRVWSVCVYLGYDNEVRVCRWVQYEFSGRFEDFEYKNVAPSSLKRIYKLGYDRKYKVTVIPDPKGNASAVFVGRV